MSIFNKTNGIELSQEDLQDAKITAGIFSDELVKKRAFANVLAARCALKLLFSLNIDATNLYSMYSINKILEKLDVADIYVGDIKIDARIINDENEIFIPKSHFQLGIQPDLYVVLKLEKDLSGVEFLGCINPDEMDKTRENKDYYFVDEELLYNIKIFKNLVKNGKSAKNYVSSQEDLERAQNLIIPFEDEDIFNADLEFLIQQLAHNLELRKKIIEFENFEFVSKKVVTEETVYGDSVLGLVGSDKLYDRGEFTTDINLDELSDATVDDFVESFKEETPLVQDIEDVVTEEIDLDSALQEFSAADNSVSADDEENFDFENGEINPDDFNINDNESSKIELENLLNEMSDFTDESSANSFEDFNEIEEGNDLVGLSDADEEIEELPQIQEDFEFGTDSLSDEDEEIGELPQMQENFEFGVDALTDADDGMDEREEELAVVSQENYTENIESIPNLEEASDEYEDAEDINFDPNASIDFDESGFTLPEIGGFSIDDTEIAEDISDSGFVNSDEENTFEKQVSDSKDIYEDNDTDGGLAADKTVSSHSYDDDDDDDPDISELPTLKIYQETPETYKKKIYKAPAIDDINMQDINLDDFDDYEKEDKEEEEKQNEEFDNMMSDLDNILSNDNLPIDSVAEILTDDELSESIKKIETEVQSDSSVSGEETEMEASENSPSLQNRENASESGISLDDFLNSSSFNEMSSNEKNSDNIEQSGIENIYQNNGDMQDTQNSETGENPEALLTDEASMVDNSTNFYNEDPVAETAKAAPKRKSSTPMLTVILVVLLCVFAYTRKDDLMANFNFGGPKEEDVPEFDLNKLREPQPSPAEPAPVENPIPTIPQPADMPTEGQAPLPSDNTAMPLNAPQAAQNAAGSRPAPQSFSNKITKLSWEVPENMASNEKIRKYLQIAGRTLKLSLQNDLHVASELPFSNRVMLDLKIAPSGNLLMSDFIISSGSKQIDDIVLQSVKDTLKYVRPPLGEIQSPNSNFTLIINF